MCVCECVSVGVLVCVCEGMCVVVGGCVCMCMYGMAAYFIPGRYFGSCGVIEECLYVGMCVLGCLKLCFN